MPRRAWVMRLLRRAHLYSGLALLPWVLLYGISGFLFNHGGGGAGAELALPAAAVDDLQLDAHDVANTMLAALGTPGSAHDARASGAWTFEFERDGKPMRLTLPLDGSSATLRAGPRRGDDVKKIAHGTFAAAGERAELAAMATLAAADIDVDQLRTIGAPTLRCRDARNVYRARLDRDQVGVRDATEDETFDLGRLMRRLHVTHGYRDERLARWTWAVIVDVMAAAMVLWSFSGIAMWWQKRSMRVAGSVALGSACVLSVLLAVALHAIFNA